MRHAITTCVVSFAISASAGAQTTSQHESSNTHMGTLACHTEKAAMTTMHTASPTAEVDRNVLIRLLLSGDCLILPTNWQVSDLENPPQAQRDNHAAKLTIRTPDGAILHMWGWPIDEP